MFTHFQPNPPLPDPSCAGLASAPLLVALLAELVLAVASLPAAADPGEDALALVAARCQKDGASEAVCACRRNVFKADVLDKATTPQAGLLAARLHAGDAGDQMKLLKQIQKTDSHTQTEAALLMSTAETALEACSEQVAEPEQSQADMPTGDTPRARFVRQCAADNQQPEICGCIADALLKKLSPQELDLMVDLSAAQKRGEEAFDALARERGLTVEEAKRGLAQLAPRIAGAMGSINPMKCVSF